MKRVIIWGDDHHNALGLLRMLGNHDFDLFFLVHAKITNIATASKYCRKYEVVDSVEKGLDYLLHNFQDSEQKPVLLFTADKFSEAANNHYDELSKYFYVAGPTKQGLLKKVDDKYTMGLMAEEHGITVPQTLLLPNENALNVKSYPIVIKPCSPGHKDFKVKIIRNKKEHTKALSYLLKDRRYVQQEFINKDADGLVYGCRAMDGKTHLAGICVRNRWSDDGCGSFGYITPSLPNGVKEECISSFLEGINFYGIFSVEYALHESGAFFYEFNLRNDGTSHLFYQGGANIALAYVNSCFGITENVPTRVSGKQYLINEFWDKYNVSDGIISKSQWKKDMERATIFFYYDEDDMHPYEIQKSLTLKRNIRRIISKSYINKKRLQFKAWRSRR